MGQYDYKLAYDTWDRSMKSAHQTRTDVYEGLTDVKSLVSNREFFKIQGTVDLQALSTEDQSIIHSSIDTEERQIQASQAFVSLKWEKGVLDRAHTDPIPGAIEATKMGMARWNAAVKRTAATGTAIAQYEGEETSSAKSLTGVQVIAQGGTSITEAKVRQVKSTFVTNKALMNGQQIMLALHQDEMDALLQIDHFINSDYSGGRAPLRDGIAANWLGVDFVLDLDLATSGTNRTCFAWTKSGILFGVQRDLLTRSGELDDRHYMDQFYLRVDNGATRTRETEVITVNTLF